MIQNVNQLYSECIAAGLIISGCTSSGTIHFLAPDENNIAPLVLAAHGQPLSSDECVALQAALTEEQWLAYQDARKAPIRSQRNSRYREETDPMRLKLDDEFDIGSEEWLVGLAAWKLAKTVIRESLPYPS